MLINDKMENAFKNLDLFLDNEIKLPELVEFSRYSNNHGIKINNHNSVNDLIKEVYKNAR